MNEQTAGRLHELLIVYGAASGYIEARNKPLYDEHIEDAYKNLVEAVRAAAPEGTDAKNEAAQALRAIPSEKRTQASRENGKKSKGRPKKTKQ